MASNKQLIEDIILLKPDAVTDGLKNDDLVAMLKDLRPQKTADTSEALKPDAAAAEAAAAEAAAADEPREYKIAQGKSVTSKKGVLGPGAIVKPEYFSLGQETIDSLIDKGYIV